MNCFLLFDELVLLKINEEWFSGIAIYFLNLSTNLYQFN